MTIHISGLTTWAGVAPRTVIACLIPVAFMPLVFYALLDKTPLTNHSTKTSLKHQEIKYTALGKDADTRVTHDLAVLFKAFPCVSYYFLAVFCLHMTNAAVLSTLTFPTAPFRPRDHYQYYRLLSDGGIQVGGIEIVLASCWSKNCLELVKIRRVWILVLLHASCLLFFVFASWYRFLPNVYIVFGLVFVQGILIGSTAVQFAALTADSFQNPRDKGTAMGFLEVGRSFGRLTAGFVGLFVERHLREHCTNSLLQGEFCLARAPSFNGWYENIHLTT